MQLTTKARYAVTAMLDIAVLEADRKKQPIRLAEIAQRQNIALNYLEQIFAKLKKAGLVSAVKGPGGGYFIANGANGTKILDIVEAVDESLKMTACSPTSTICGPEKAKCSSHDLWKGLTGSIREYLGSKTLQDILDKK
jgi:Rrf2 family iron-sulfur cluster assembly transcriptional regulator